jgi:hypothetical protein
VCTNAASRARDGDPRFAPVALAGYTAADTLSDLPIEQASKFTLVKTTKELSIAVPPTLLSLADEVIE